VSRHIWPTAGLFTLGFGAALVAVLGPLVTEAIRYHVSDGAANQVLDGDIAGLVLVAPMSLLAGVLVWRGHGAGPILALGPAFYALYMYMQLALGGDFFRYEGNSELYFPVFPLLIDKISLTPSPTNGRPSRSSIGQPGSSVLAESRLRDDRRV
jgi:hypothetical protein